MKQADAGTFGLLLPVHDPVMLSYPKWLAPVAGSADCLTLLKKDCHFVQVTSVDKNYILRPFRVATAAETLKSRKRSQVEEKRA